MAVLAAPVPQAISMHTGKKRPTLSSRRNKYTPPKQHDQLSDMLSLSADILQHQQNILLMLWPGLLEEKKKGENN